MLQLCTYRYATTAPSGAPDMFEAEVGQRQVVFSWSPPPVTQHNGLITSYTLSCSPSPSSHPQSPSQSGLFTVAGFSPDTSYSCSVVANNGLGSGPPAHTNFTTLQDCEFVQWFTCAYVLYIKKIIGQKFALQCHTLKYVLVEWSLVPN